MFRIQTEFKNKQEIIKEGYALYRQSFWRAISYSLIAACFIFAPQLILGSILSNSTSLISSYLDMLAPLGIAWGVGLIFISALIFRLYCIANNVPSRFLGSLHHATLKLLPLLLLSVLYSFIVISGTLFLIIPGIIFAISLMLAFIIFIIGNQSVLKSLTTSHTLVSRYWWHSLSVISIPLLMNITVSLAAFFALAHLSILFHLGELTLYLCTFLIGIVIQTLFIPLVFSIALVLVQDLGKRDMVSRPSW